MNISLSKWTLGSLLQVRNSLKKYSISTKFPRMFKAAILLIVSLRNDPKSINIRMNRNKVCARSGILPSNGNAWTKGTV